MKKAWELFGSILYLSAFTFGGGFVIITLMKKTFVDEKHWIDEEEMLDMTAIAQSSPGSIAVNASILIGYKVMGIPGVLLALLGTIIPPIAIITVISMCYDAFRSNVLIAGALKGMQAAVAAIVLDVSLRMALKIGRAKDWISVLVMAASFICVFFLKVNILTIILVCAAIGVARLLLEKKEGGNEV